RRSWRILFWHPESQVRGVGVADVRFRPGPRIDTKSIKRILAKRLDVFADVVRPVRNAVDPFRRERLVALRLADVAHLLRVERVVRVVVADERAGMCAPGHVHYGRDAKAGHDRTAGVAADHIARDDLLDRN